MNQATLWIIIAAITVHMVLACVAIFYLYKDTSISIRTKVVHGLLAWLVPFIDWVFSINSFFGLGVSESGYDNYKHDFTYGKSEMGDGDGGD